MYSDPQKWSYTFQSYVQLTILQHHALKTCHPIKLMERSVYSARYCFVEQLMRSGCIEDCSVAVMDEWVKWAKEASDISVDLIGKYNYNTKKTTYSRPKSAL